MSQHFTIVNRTARILNGTWDGRQYELAPGEHTFPEIQARKFRDQNPIMGSEDPYSLRKKYLIGIKELGDDITPIEQSTSVELLDRSKMEGAPPVVVIKGKGLFNPYTDTANRLPTSSTGFEANRGA